jgi:hypothetical protein
MKIKKQQTINEKAEMKSNEKKNIFQSSKEQPDDGVEVDALNFIISSDCTSLMGFVHAK